MRRARGVLALLSSVLLGLVLVAAGQPGSGRAPDLGKRWVSPAPPGAAHLPTPLLGKRWS